MISIATMGKFTGIPPRKASAKYGGGTSAAVEYIDTHKFPVVRVTRVKTDKSNKYINISVGDIEEEEGY